MAENMNYTSNKIAHSAKENEEKKANERKKNILYLITNYLNENGFHSSALSLMSEAQLSNNVEVCDNVDLELILLEYTNFYFMKFKKYPKICKKRLEQEQNLSSSAKINNQSRNNQVKSSTKTVPKKIEKDETSPLSIIVTPLLKVGGEGDENNDAGVEAEIIKPLHEYSGFTSEWKELANVILKEVITNDLKIHWRDIKGLENCITLLKEAIVYPIEYPKLFSKIVSPWKGILLYGPPGTGKTMLAKALVSECKIRTFFNMTASSLISKWRGDSEKLIRVLFELARFRAPSTLFFDEIDALASKRDECQHDASRRFKSEFLIQLDGLNSTNEDVFVLATTNLPWELDPAILRRFEKRIFVDYPSTSARRDIFCYYLSKMTDTSCLKRAHFNEFAESTENYSGSDIKVICKEAALIPIRRQIQTNSDNCQNEPVSFDDVITAIRNVKPSTTNQKYLQWHREYGHV